MRFLVFLALIFNAPAGAQDLGDLFVRDGLTGTLVIRRMSDSQEWIADPARAEQRFLPASTFKIANALIILEAGVVADPDTDILSWDGVERSPGWDRDQSLRSAFRRSAVWAYQHWARAVGHDRMQAAVTATGYGNADIGPPPSVDRFWLDGPLMISAREQIAFLQRLQSRDLPFRPEVMDQVVDVMEVDRDADWVLRAKTGWVIRSNPDIGWYVGWLETRDNTYFFALNMDLGGQGGQGALRSQITREALSRVTGIDLSPRP